MKCRQIIFVFAVFHFFITTISAQANSKIIGRVADANNAVIAGANVRLSNQSIRFERETVTDRNGAFSFENLPEGNYRITATAGSFGALEEKIQISGDRIVDLTLQPAQIAEQVSVTASYLAGSAESLSEIPGTIERIDAQTLENSRVYNFSEALRKISGVNVRDEEGFGLRPNIGIRGTNPTRSTKVLLLEDGIPLSYAPYGDNASYYHPPIDRYESIEVL